MKRLVLMCAVAALTLAACGTPSAPSTVATTVPAAVATEAVIVEATVEPTVEATAATTGEMTSTVDSGSAMTDTTMMTDTTAMTDSTMMTDTTTMTDTAMSNMTVGETAMADNQFSTLVELAVLAGITPTLTGPDPITVFAPTNAAFAKLPQATLDDLMKPENKATLVKILTYHVVSGRVMAADVMTMTSAKSVEGSDLTIATSGSDVTVNGAKIIAPDIVTKNGVIHVIDTVLMPPNP